MRPPVCECGGTVNPIFAPHQPNAHGVPLPDVVIRTACRDDLPRTAALAVQRDGGVLAEWATIQGRQFDDDNRVLLVAERHGEVLGYAWLAWLTPVADGGRNAPDGWYLSGIAVAPAFRRRGIGRRLTWARIRWVLQRQPAVFYVVSASNQSSRALHAELGFREVSDDFVVPGLVFANDDGILCRLEECADAEVIDLADRRH